MHPRSRLSSHQSSSFAKKRRTRKVIVWCAGLLVFGAAIFSISWIARAGFLRITDVEVFGVDQDIVPAVHAVATGELKGAYLGLISRADTLFYPKRDIIQSVEASSPRIDSVSVRREGAHALVLTIAEKPPAALICAGLPDWNGNTLIFDDSDPCYFADAAGQIFKAASSTGSQAFQRYYAPDLTGSAATGGSVIGAYAASSTEFKAMQGFYSGVQSAGIAAAAVLIKDGGEYELYARNPGGKNVATTSIDDVAVIYFGDEAPFSSQLANLAAFWGHEESSPSQPVRFSDIKLQYPPNVYYTISK